MSPYRRNFMVGAVVLGALLILAWMLIQFGGQLVLPFAAAKIPVRFRADRADGLSNGSPVQYRGVIVGGVESVWRADDQLSVFIDALLDRDPRLPGNLKAVIRSQNLVGGGSAIVLELTEPNQPRGKLEPNQVIPGHFVGLDLMPPEFADLANELRAVTRQLRESNLVAHVDEQVTRAGQLIDSVQSLVGDPKLREDLKASLSSIRSTTEKADRIAGKLEEFSDELGKLSSDTSDTIARARSAIGATEQQVLNLSKQLSDRLQQTSKLLDHFQSIAGKLDSGQGTAGQFINDRRLYEGLVDATRQLNSTVLDLKRLLEQWEQEGLSLRTR